MNLQKLLEHPNLQFDKNIFSIEEKKIIFQQKLILTKNTRSNVKKILISLINKRNILLIGDAGIGKNALIYYINFIRGVPTIRFSFNQDTLTEDLLGSYHLENNQFMWKDGTLVEAMKKGYVFVADEMNLAIPEILKRFLGVWENRKITLYEKDNSTVYAHPMFTFIATQNPSKGFEGRKKIPIDITKNFTISFLENYSLEETQEILSKLYEQIPKDKIKIIVHIQEELEKLFFLPELSNTVLEHYHFNIRTAKSFCSRIIIEKNYEDIVSFINSVFAFYIDAYPNVLKERILKILYSVFKKTIPSFSLDMRQLEELYSQYKRIQYSQNTCLFSQENEYINDVFPVTQKRLHYLYAIKKSIESNENLLLEGNASARLKELIDYFAFIQNKKIVRIPLAKDMHTSEVIGALKPSANGLQWQDGILTKALKEGSWILLENLEVANSAFVEKLNMLLDDGNCLLLPPEADGDILLNKKDSTKIIALKKVRTNIRQNTISRALRNRFTSIYIETLSLSEELLECLLLYFIDTIQENISHEWQTLMQNMVRLHTKLSIEIEKQNMKSTLSDTIEFTEENLLRWLTHIFYCLPYTEENLQQTVYDGMEMNYKNRFSDIEDKRKVDFIWENINSSIPYHELEEEISTPKWKKKTLLNYKNEKKKRNWDPKKYFRTDEHGRAKKKISGDKLKEGIPINTKETGGSTKEGKDAWYGKDTLGNKGVGQVSGGGGEWGYRTKEIFENFLKKYKPLFEYSLNIPLQEYYAMFHPILQKIKIDFENTFLGESEIHRNYSHSGLRVDIRKYIASQRVSQDSRVFDRTKIIDKNVYFDDVECIIAINKGRRMFNFKSSLGGVIAVQSILEVFYENQIPCKVFGYSDITNQKQDVNIEKYLEYKAFFPQDTKSREKTFDSLTKHWFGDTVKEYPIFEKMISKFSQKSKIRILIFISDFRGHRGKRNIEDEKNSFETEKLQQTVAKYVKENYNIIGVQLGNRYIGENIFNNIVYINEANFFQSNENLWIAIKKILVAQKLRY